MFMPFFVLLVLLNYKCFDFINTYILFYRGKTFYLFYFIFYNLYDTLLDSVFTFIYIYTIYTLVYLLSKSKINNYLIANIS